MRISNVYKEIKNITFKLLEVGLADEYKMPVSTDTTVNWAGYSDISHALKNVPYKHIYSRINSMKNFNFKLPDGGIFQLHYNFDVQGLLKHRLAYFPSPDFEEYQNNPQIYCDDELYGDVVNKQVMPVIVRFDYNRDDVVSENHHPYTHLTLGQYKNCRVPVEGPLSPNKFVSFILDNFYHVPNNTFLNCSFTDYVIENYSHINEIDLKKIYMKII